MSRKEAKKYKALYFDLGIRKLEKYYSKTSPKTAYAKIGKFLNKHKFSHAQYSGYHSNYKTTDLEIFDLVHAMDKEMPWLHKCVNHFEVTNIGKNYDLMDLFVDHDIEEF